MPWRTRSSSRTVTRGSPTASTIGTNSAALMNARSSQNNLSDLAHCGECFVTAFLAETHAMRRSLRCVYHSLGLLGGCRGTGAAHPVAEDARLIAAQFVADTSGASLMDAFAKVQGWEPRRVNPGISFLAARGFAEVSDAIDLTYESSWVRRTPLPAASFRTEQHGVDHSYPGVLFRRTGRESSPFGLPLGPCGPHSHDTSERHSRFDSRSEKIRSASNPHHRRYGRALSHAWLPPSQRPQYCSTPFTSSRAGYVMMNPLPSLSDLKLGTERIIGTWTGCNIFAISRASKAQRNRPGNSTSRAISEAKPTGCCIGSCYLEKTDKHDRVSAHDLWLTSVLIPSLQCIVVDALELLAAFTICAAKRPDAPL